MEKITPFSDGKMLYNATTMQYELDMGFIKGEFGNLYADDNVLQVRIKRNTRKVYNYIFSHAYSGNRKIITAMINHTAEYRNFIFDALFSQMEADMASGFNDQDLYVKDTHDQRQLQHENQVSVGTQNILESSAGYGGINLLYAGVFNYLVYLEFMEYAKWFFKTPHKTPIS